MISKEEEQARREALEKRLAAEERERKRKREERERRLAMEAEGRSSRQAEKEKQMANTQQKLEELADSSLDLLDRLTQRNQVSETRPRDRRRQASRSRSISVKPRSRSRKRPKLSFDEALKRRMDQREATLDSSRIPVTWSREELKARNYKI